MGLAIIIPSISFEDANLGKVTIGGNVPIKNLYINIEDSYTGTLVNLKCSYSPVNTTQRNVVWSIESGSEYASINGSVLQILSNANNSSVVIKCTSVENPNINTSKIVKLTYFNKEGSNYVLYDWLKTDSNNASYVNIGKLGRNDKLTIIGKTLDFQPISAPSAIFGVSDANINWIYNIFFSHNNNTKLGNNNSEYTANIYSQNLEFSIIIDIATGKIEIGNNTGSVSINDSMFVNNETVNDCFVFAANKNGEPISYMNSVLYALKEFKIERNNQVIHDFKPALYENKKGLFDIVTNQFKPNLGTGNFILENN